MNTNNSSYISRRRFKRVGFNSRVAVLHGGEFKFETGMQVGEGGMRLEVNNAYNIGDVVEVCFFLTDTDYISAVAEILYELKPEQGARQVGVRFVQLSPQIQATVRRFIENYPVI